MVADPTLVRSVRANVVVETEGRWTAGATVVDLDRYTGRPDTATVGLELQVDRFFDLLVDAVATYR